jgi:Xaa-Pro dipeptidase
MKRDMERVRRIRVSLEEKRIDALVCALPSNVLLLSGYWPVVGPSVAIATRDGEIILIVPKDEKSLAKNGWADEVLTFSHGSLEKISNAIDNLQAPLIETITRLNLFSDGVLGCEDKAEFQPASYAAMYFPDLTFQRLLQETFPQTRIVSSDEIFSRFRARLTPGEIERVRISCEIAEDAFRSGAERLREGLTETEAAHFFRGPLTLLPNKVHRADGFVYCMSGVNSFEAFASFQRSRPRKIQTGDLVLIHCNSYADGFWTDITRTFCIGEPNQQQRKIFEAIFDARDAAVAAVRPGVQASAVDKAAREKLKEHGFEKEFRHATGHGVGFVAINHNALPRIHPQSRDILETGMVFNIEPGIYIEGIGGMRHCDMVVVTENGVEILTPFQSSMEDLILQQEEFLTTNAH